MKRLACLIVVLAFVSGAVFAQEGKPTEKKQFAYVLKLIPRLLDEKNWTAKENAIVGSHFERLKRLHEQGKIVLAGRSLTLDQDAFGIVIFEAASEEEAREIMESDDAVKAGIMTAKLFSFHVALKR